MDSLKAAAVGRCSVKRTISHFESVWSLKTTGSSKPDQLLCTKLADNMLHLCSGLLIFHK